MKNKLLILFIFLLNISCSTSSEYIPVGTNCKKYSRPSVIEVFFDALLGYNEDENGNYDYNLEYKECIRNERLKRQEEKKIQNEKDLEIFKNEMQK